MPSTGLPGLDRVFRGLTPGDNVVWQVDSVSDFSPFMLPYCRSATAGGGRLVYFRFARHDPLVPEPLGATIHQLDTGDGFERFIAAVHQKIHEAGPEASFVFDCLSSLAEVRQYSQRKVDVIDLEANQFVSRDFARVASRSFRLPVEIFASRGERSPRGPGRDETADRENLVLTFDDLLTRTPFVADMREMLQTLREAYDYPVDLEFTANFLDRDRYKINLVQCRPLQVLSDSPAVALPETIEPDDRVLEARGAVIGRSRVNLIDRLVYVSPSAYGQLPLGERYSIARLIGRLLHVDRPSLRQVMLVGPGRWGTTTPSLGVPVSFAEIDTARILCEIVAMREDLVPDVSLGTHFFNDLVEMDVLYMALFPGREGNSWNRAFFEQTPNRLAEIMPGEAKWSHVVRVLDMPLASCGGAVLTLNANAMTQQVVCYLERE